MTSLDQAAPAPPGGSPGSVDPAASDRAEVDHTARNRRLGWILFGIFAALAIFSIIFIDLRSVGR